MASLKFEEIEEVISSLGGEFSRQEQETLINLFMDKIRTKEKDKEEAPKKEKKDWCVVKFEESGLSFVVQLGDDEMGVKPNHYAIGELIDEVVNENNAGREPGSKKYIYNREAAFSVAKASLFKKRGIYVKTKNPVATIDF